MNIFSGVILVQGIPFLMFSTFVCIFVGFLLGRITIKGISLGSSGVFIIALLYGALFSSHIKETISQKSKEGKTIDISSNGLKIIENIGLILFIGSVGFISGPSFFKNLKKNFKSYIFVGFIVIAISTFSCVIIFYSSKKNEKNTDEFVAMMVGLYSGALTSTPAFSAAKASVVGEFESAVTVGYGIAYIFGVLGIVLFVQIVPKILGADMDLERELIMDKGYRITKRIGTERTEKTDITRINIKKYKHRNPDDIQNKISNLEKSDMKSEEERGMESDKRIVMVFKKDKDKDKDKEKPENKMIKGKETEKEIEINKIHKKDEKEIEKEIIINDEIEKKSEKEEEINKKEFEKNNEKEKDINVIIIDENENDEEDKGNDSSSRENEDKSQKENLDINQKENKSNYDKESNDKKLNKEEEKLFVLDKNGFCVFAFGAIIGIFMGAIRIPLSKKGLDGSAFSLTTTGGVLITCLILGHFGRICRLSLKVEKKVLENFRELGLILFLFGSGISGGTKFIEYFKIIYFLYGMIITLLPLICGFLFNKYILKLCLFNNLGSLTGAMTSTPALGTVINVAKTDSVGNSYAATYPISLICVVLSAQFMALLMK